MNRKAICICLSLGIMVFCLTGCKSEEVKEVETLIDSIGEVGPDSGPVIEEAQEAYDDLSRDDRNQVDNYEVLEEAEEAYNEVVDGFIDEANGLLSDFGAALDYYDLTELSSIIDEYETVYVMIPEDRLSDLSGNVNSPEDLRYIIDNLCYPDTNIVKFYLVVGSSGITDNVEMPGTPGTEFPSDYYGSYQYSNGYTASDAYYQYLDY